MTTERRFALEFIVESSNGPGLVQEEDGAVVYVKPDGSRAEIDSGGSGGGGNLLVAKTTISSAEILALDSSPVVIVPAVPGKLIQPVSFAFEYVAGATPYTDHGSSIDVSIGTSFIEAVSFMQFHTAGWWDQPTSQFVFGNGIALGGLSGEAVAVSGHLVGFPLRFGYVAAPALPTGGDGTIQSTVSYLLVDVV